MSGQSELEDIARLIPIDQVAAALGVDDATAKSAVDAALPALVGGMQANAQDPGGASSLLSALLGKDTSLISGGVSLADVDTDDGAKIVQHIFGPNQDQVVAALGSTGKASSGILAKLLPILAPIVMTYIANKIAGAGSKTAEATTAAAPTTTPAAAPAEQPSAGGLGDILGSILGGSSSSSGGLGGLGSILGGLLGGGTK